MSEINNLKIHYNTIDLLEGGQDVKVKWAVVHSDYKNDNKDFSNDIALLRTATPMSLNQINAKAAVLPTTGNDPQEGKNIFMSGWGVTNSSNDWIPADLQKATLPVVNRTICKEAYNQIAPVTEVMFCAGKMGIGGVDSCQVKLFFVFLNFYYYLKLYLNHY